MKWISTTDQMRRSDAYASGEMKVPSLLLMEAAARSVADRLCEVCRKEDDILFLCGTGNNGGDGFACARMMKHRGYSVRVFCAGDPARLKGDAKVNFDMLSSYSISVLTMEQGSAFNHLAEQSEWVVDALFGTGLNAVLGGFYAQIVASINKLHADGQFKVLSIDIPSGVEGDSGKVLGNAIFADETVTFCRLKPGLVLYPGSDYAGKVHIADIGIPETIPPMMEADLFSLEDEDLNQMIPARKTRSHKGLYGKVLAVCGSASMAGAAVFTSTAAYKVGAGLVECTIPKESAGILMTKLPEAITSPYEAEEEADFSWIDEKVQSATTIACGPGLSRKAYAHHLLQRILTVAPSAKTLVLDADALNLLSEDPALKELVKSRCGNTVLTPHMAEASRLLHVSIGEILAEPLKYVRKLAEEFNCVAVLKDAMTLVAESGGKGRVFFNSTGNNGMSTGGSGDVLTGMIAGLLAQGMNAFDASCCGVYLHGRAGDNAREDVGTYGMMAGDILRHIHIAANER